MKNKIILDKKLIVLNLLKVFKNLENKVYKIILILILIIIILQMIIIITIIIFK